MIDYKKPLVQLFRPENIIEDDIGLWTTINGRKILVGGDIYDRIKTIAEPNQTEIVFVPFLYNGTKKFHRQRVAIIIIGYELLDNDEKDE